MTATATPEFHEFYCIDANEDQNRSIAVYRAMERGEFKPLRLVMDAVTGTRYVTANTLGNHEVIIHDLTFQEQVDEVLTGSIFSISNEADDRASLHLPTGDAFNDVNFVMCEVEHGLNEFGFKWYTVATDKDARDMMAMRDALVIEVTENGAYFFRG